QQVVEEIAADKPAAACYEHSPHATFLRPLCFRFIVASCNPPRELPCFTLTLPYAAFTLNSPWWVRYADEPLLQENEAVTKKEIVKQISDRIQLTQLKTKEIVQLTFDAIVDTLLEVGRIELRNFAFFEFKQRKARKARNPRTGDRVDVPPKFVVTFKPGKEMEERVRQMTHLPEPRPETEEDEDDGELVAETANGHGETGEGVVAVSKSTRTRHG